MNGIQLKDKAGVKILVRAANWVGDAIMTTPVIRAVRKNYPNAHITVLAKPWVTPVYQNNPYIDDMMIYHARGRHKKGFGTIRLAKEIKRGDFQLAVLLQNAFEAALISFLAGIAERLGYDTDGRTWLLNRPVKMNPALKNRHLVEYYLGILSGAGLLTDGKKTDLILTHDETKEARALLEEKGVDLKKPVIGINPGAAGGTAKRWFPDRYAQVAKDLSARLGVKVIIFGGPGDEDLGHRINSASGHSCINLAGQTSLRMAFALIDQCALFISNDSGLMHAAAALGINQIAIIGPTNHLATYPDDDRSVVIRKAVSCSPCMKSQCPTDHRCMTRISPGNVLEKAMEILDG